MHLLIAERRKRAWSDVILPGVRNRSRFTCLLTGEGRSVRGEFAGIAFVFQLLPLIRRHHGHGFLPQWIIRIFTHHDEDPRGACTHALATAVAEVGVDRYEEIP